MKSISTCVGLHHRPSTPNLGAKRATWASLAALSLAASACSDDAIVLDAPPGPGEPMEPGEGEETPAHVYAMTVHAFGPDSTTSYLVATPSLEAGNVLDLDTAIELPDYANVSGIPGEPYVWLGYDTSPIIERWDLAADGSFDRGPSVSFANLGAASVSPDAQGAFISTELAAVPNQATGELVFWNPSSMEIIDSLALEIPDREGIPAYVRSTTARPDGTLLLSYYYLSGEGEFADVAGIVVVDPEGLEIIGRDEWEGCNYNYARAAEDGTVYLTVGAQWIQGSLVYADGGPWLAEPCLLRVLPDATEFDRSLDSHVLAELAGGREITGNLELAGDGEAYFVAWQDELMTEEFTVDNFDDVRFSTPAYKWYRWQLGSDQASEVPGDPFAALPSVSTIDGRLFYSDQRLVGANGGRGIAPNYELTPSGPLPAFIAYGTIWNVLRVR
jgi:hypothetical protein